MVFLTCVLVSGINCDILNDSPTRIENTVNNFANKKASEKSRKQVKAKKILHPSRNKFTSI